MQGIFENTDSLIFDASTAEYKNIEQTKEWLKDEKTMHYDSGIRQ